MSLPRGQSSHQRHFSRSMVLSWGTLRAGGLHGIDRRGPGQRDVLHNGGEAPRRAARADAREFFGWGLQHTRSHLRFGGLGIAAPWLVDRKTVCTAPERAYRQLRRKASHDVTSRFPVER